MKSPRLARSLRRWPRFVVSVTGGTESSPLAPADVGRPRAHHDDAHDQELIRKSCIVTFSAWAEPTSRPSTTTVSAMAAPARCHRRVRAGLRAARRAIGSITIVSFLKFVDLQYARVARPVHRQIRRSAIPRWQDHRRRHPDPFGVAVQGAVRAAGRHTNPLPLVTRRHRAQRSWPEPERRRPPVVTTHPYQWPARRCRPCPTPRAVRAPHCPDDARGTRRGPRHPCAPPPLPGAPVLASANPDRAAAPTVTGHPPTRPRSVLEQRG